jgi:hypothetical protein
MAMLTSLNTWSFGARSSRSFIISKLPNLLFTLQLGNQEEEHTPLIYGYLGISFNKLVCFVIPKVLLCFQAHIILCPNAKFMTFHLCSLTISLLIMVRGRLILLCWTWMNKNLPQARMQNVWSVGGILRSKLVQILGIEWVPM